MSPPQSHRNQMKSDILCAGVLEYFFIPTFSLTFVFRLNGLPEDPSVFVFCNFNKIDKLDPGSLSSWMNVSGHVCEENVIYGYYVNV